MLNHCSHRVKYLSPFSLYPAVTELFRSDLQDIFTPLVSARPSRQRLVGSHRARTPQAGNVGETTTGRKACLTCKAGNVAAAARGRGCRARAPIRTGSERVPAARNLRLRQCCTSPPLFHFIRQLSFPWMWMDPSSLALTKLGGNLLGWPCALHYYCAI